MQGHASLPSPTPEQVQTANAPMSVSKSKKYFFSPTWTSACRPQVSISGAARTHVSATCTVLQRVSGYIASQSLASNVAFITRASPPHPWEKRHGQARLSFCIVSVLEQNIYASFPYTINSPSFLQGGAPAPGGPLCYVLGTMSLPWKSL
jgi:hypothetical protein